MAVTRREFVAAGAALAGGIGVGDAEAVIDTHQHLWDLDRVKPPWLAGAPEVLRARATTVEYREATAGLGVARAVYMEVDVAPGDQEAEAEAVLDLIRGGGTPTVAAVIGGRPASAGFAAYLDRFGDAAEVKGVRQVLHGAGNPRGECLEAAFVEGVRLLGRRGLSFDLCLRPAELDDGAKLAEKCPETRFIVDHCGNADPKAFRRGAEQPSHDPDEWRRAMERLAARPNVVCKVSGIVARAPQGWSPADLEPIVDHCLDMFGPDRVVFGVDWPVCLTGATFGEWLGALRRIVARRPAEARRKLLAENAAKFYGL